MLTKKSKYGLKAMLMLAEQSGQGPVLVADLADRQRLPKKFLEAILLELKRHGLLHSKKGGAVGTCSAVSRRRSPWVRSSGARRALALVPCVSQTAYMRCDECPDEKTCGVRLAMKDVRDATAEILDHMTLADSRAADPGRRRGEPSRTESRVPPPNRIRG
jgi:DNA-binding IscR family transcriptional regulator